MRRLLLQMIFAACAIGSANAQIGVGPAAEAARNQAKTYGAGQLPSVKGAVTGANPSSTVPGYAGPGQPQTQYFQGGMGDPVSPGSARAGACAGQTDAECQAIQLLLNSRTTRPQFDIGPNDPLVSLNRGRTQNPTSIAGDIFSSYETCRTVTTVHAPILENKVCEDYSTLETTTCRIGMDVVVDADHLYKCMERLMSQYNASCTIGRVIVVDKDYIYQCQQSPKKIETLTCKRTLSVVCQAGGDGCTPSGVVPGSTQGDMAIGFSHIGGGTWQLDFGIFANNTWTGGGFVQEDRSMTFNIANVNDLTQFMFVYTRYDDWVWIRLNGISIYAGPKPGADRAIMVNWCDPNNEFSGCTKMVQYTADASLLAPVNQRATTHEFTANWDIRGGLRNGLNTIDMRVIRDYRGEGAARFHVRAACPSNCTDQWSNGCASLEQRSQ